MTLHEAQQLLTTRLTEVYDKREAANIAGWVMEHLTGKKKIDRITHNTEQLPASSLSLLQQYSNELLAHKPVQYVLQEAWFCGMKLFVNEQVLIPRPETEELVEEVRNTKFEVRNISILDVGTGSGCIAIALKKKLPGCQVYACDVSEGALAVAKKNAADQQTSIYFLSLNFLDKNTWATLPNVDVIVSNPPYIPQQDKAGMHKNVLDYEPHLALFVDNDDPLIFYEAIAEFALTKLKPGGGIYAEIHEDLGESVKNLFLQKGFAAVEIKKDMQGKDRVVRVSSK